MPDTLARRLFQPTTIYFQPEALEYSRGREVLDRYPDAERIEVASHQNIPGLFGNEGAARDWVKIKRTVLVLGVRKTFPVRPNGRSADFIAPGHSNGCLGACLYCYVPRHKGFANPVTLYVNIEGVEAAIRKHAARQGPKTVPNQTDPLLWTYDIGENSDCSADALLSDNVRDLVGLFRELPNAKATWATKFVNRDLLNYDPQGHTRIRFSLMPADTARVLDVRTSPVAERLDAVNDFVDAGYEVHLNFSPVVVTDGWQQQYTELFEHVDNALSARAKAQVAAEIIFLTHHAGLHDVNVRWHPKGEALIWRPDLQEAKVTGQGGDALRYRHDLKGSLVGEFRALLARKLPYCRVRYAF